MKNKNRILTNNARTLKKAFPRFVSLVIMSLLGVFVFAGLMATEPDMVKTVDNYLDEQNGYDIRIISTLGFDAADVDAVKSLNSIKNAEGAKTLDLSFTLDEEQYTLQCDSISSDMNQVIVNEGRLPEKKGEIAVESYFLTNLGYKIGDTLHFENDSLNSQDLTIVGSVTSPLYYNRRLSAGSRGSVVMPGSTVSYYAYIDNDDFNFDYYTLLFATVKGAKELTTSYSDYQALIDEALDEISVITEARIQARYEELLVTREELVEAKAQLEEAETKLNDTKQQLEEGRTQLDSAKVQLAESETQLTDAKKQLDAASKELAEGKAQLEAGEKQLAASRAQLDQYEAEYEQALADNNLTEDTIESTENLLKAAATPLQATVNAMNKAISALEREIAELDISTTWGKTHIAALNAAKSFDQAILDKAQKALDEVNTGLSGIAQLKSAKEQLTAGEELYAEKYQEYLTGKEQYESGLAEYESGLSQYKAGRKLYESKYAEYEAGEQQYVEGLAAYEDGLTQYEEGKTQYDETISKLKAASWYVYDRNGYSAYQQYIDQTVSMKNLSHIFPLIFFAVAVLISLISMNRMVEEDRTEIGTLMSLGFERKHIRSKYLDFSLLATLVGGIIGAITGLTILPRMIFNIYNSLLFELPPCVATLQPVTTILGFGITILCVCGTSVLTVQKVLREKPSQLMRPKAPKNGKRILLEKVHFLWNHMSFSKKVTARNIFRYKKRVLITIGGIIGCTVLILTGFGIKDSVKNLPAEQESVIFHYDGMATVTSMNKGDFLSNNEIESIFAVEQSNITAEGQKIYFCVVENAEDLKDYILLRDKNTRQEISLEEGKIIVTEKFAETYGLKVGDILSFTDADENKFQVEISGLVDNYINHYVYMTAETYESLGYDFEPNVVFFNTTDLTAEREETLSKELLDTGDVYSVTFNDAMVESVSKLFKSLDSVVWILLIFSGALCFVVLFNLSNINISERKREIATLKVLGFYDKEVDSYIIKETIILTGVGIIIGLIAGIFVSHLVVSNIEISYCRFMNEVQPISFVLTAVFVVLFTLIVNLVTHFHLKRISMIDSLKSVE